MVFFFDSNEGMVKLGTRLGLGWGNEMGDGDCGEEGGREEELKNERSEQVANVIAVFIVLSSH